MKTKAKIAALVMALSVAVSPVSAAAEWQQDPYQNWQWTENGVPVTGWEFINQNWYYFDANGYMVTGWQKIEGKQYYFNANGTLAVGWAQIGGNWYYFNGSGEMMTGWQRVEGYWYYMNSQGVMQKGWLTYGRDRYYLDENGAMEIGWVEVGDDWYFMNHDGLLQTGLIEVNGEVFYLDGDGKMLTGKQTLPGGTFNFDKETGAATGNKIPKPGKAFDAFGNEAEVTVAGSSGSSSSSGGTTVIYVPVDNGNSGNQGGNWNPGWDDDDDHENPGWNPGGDDNDDNNPSGEPPEPVAEDLQLLDAFFESKIPEINADYERDFNVSFDKESHVITIEIKNLEKRITNIRYGNLLYELVDYKNGLVTDWRLGSYEYNALYDTWENAEGSEYHRPIFLSRYATDFVNSGLSVFATTETLIGKSAEVTLLLGGTMPTEPYTINFVQASETVEDNPNCKMNVLYEDQYGRYDDYYETVQCLQRDYGVRVEYQLPDGYEYAYIQLSSGNYLEEDNSISYLGYTAPYTYKTPETEIVDNGDGSFTTTYMRDNNGKGEYSVSYDENGFTIWGLDLSRFYYWQYLEEGNPEYDVIGRIYVRPIESTGQITVNGYRDDYISLNGNGLTLALPEGDVYNLRLDFSRPISFNGYSVEYVYLYDLLDTLDDENRYPGDANTRYPSSYYYDCTRKVSSADTGEYTYKFGYFDFRVVYSETDGERYITLPQLTKNKLSGVSLDVDIQTDNFFACYVNGKRTDRFRWGDNGQGLVINVSADSLGTFQLDDFSVNFAKPTQMGDIYLNSINVRWRQYWYEDDTYEWVWEADANWENAYGTHYYAESTDREETNKGYIYHFQDVDDGFSFTVKVSEDGKQIYFPDLNQSMIAGNIMSVDTTVEVESVEEQAEN